jgi:hypothetical protein
MTRYSHLNPSLPQPSRLRNQHTGRELVIAARPDLLYVDEVKGEPLEVVGQLLPLSPSPSRLPWSVQNLRSCPSCGELVQKDLNYCPYDGRRLAPPDAPAAASAVQPPEGERD